MPSLPRRLRRLFWEARPARIDPDRHADYVLARVLEFGGEMGVRWLVRHYGLDHIHRFLATSARPELTPRTLSFWRAVFHAENETWRAPPAFRRNSSAFWVA